MRYVKVKKGMSPYDGNIRYWSNRWKTSTSPTRRNLYKLQKGKCKWCKGSIYTGQVVEIDHIIPKKDGGSSNMKNLRLVHGHCHDQIHVH